MTGPSSPAHARMKTGAKATREAVFAACTSLAMSGVIPTVRDVLKVTGGSLSTITPLRDEWWASIVSKLREGETVKGVPAAVSELFVGLWKASTAHAQHALDADRAAMRRTVEEASQATAAALADAQAANQRAATADAALAAAVAAKAQADHLAAQVAAEHQAVVATLSSQLDGRTAELRAATEGRTADAARWDDERKRLLVQVDGQRQEASRAQALVSKLEPQLAEARTRTAADAVRLEQLERELASAVQEAQRARAAELAAASQAADAITQRESLAAELRTKDALLQSQREALLANADATRSFATEMEGFKRQMVPQSPPASSKRRASRRPTSESKPQR